MNTTRLSRMQFYALSRSMCGSDADSICQELEILFKSEAPQINTLVLWLSNFKETKATLDSIEIEQLHDENNETLPSSKRSYLKPFDLNEKSSSLIPLQNEIKQLIKKINTYKEREKEMSAFRESVNATIESYKSQIYDLLQETSDLKTEMEKLSQKETEHKRELREEICSLKMTNLELSQELTAAKYGKYFDHNVTMDTTSPCSVEMSQSAVKDFEAEIAAAQEENECLKTENLNLKLQNEKAIQELEARVVSIQKENEHFKTESLSLISLKEKALQELEAHAVSVQEENKRLKAENLRHNLSKVISNKECAIQDYAQELDSATQKIERLTYDNTMLVEMNANHLAKFVQLENDWDEMIANFAQILIGHNQEKQSFDAQNIDESNKKLFESLFAELNAKSHHIELLDKEANHLEAQILDLTETTKKSETNLNAEKTELLGQLNSMSKLNEDLKAQILVISNTETNLNAEKTELLDQLNNISKLYEDLKTTILVQKSEKRQLHQQVEEYKKEIKHKNAQLKEFVQRTCNLEEFLINAENHMADSKKCYEVLSSRYADLEKEYENAKNEYEAQISELLKQNEKDMNASLFNDSANISTRISESTRIVGVRNKAQLDVIDDESMIESS